ncbi:mitochondrial import inner membrane translocase subunit Tim54 [Mortierella sp. GBAus27b]|nr:mitochondrial import inner membrane translocase subunit tim54 [Mortierella sp. GBA43]KAI8352783.1 mitochondrial import inner membrane translocase subunit Tim54 [Mortierella sp. GBAus27b]
MDSNSSTTEARPQLTPSTGSAKPVPTTLAGKLRAKLPSRGWMIFWGTVGTIGALVYRDHLLTVAAKKRVVDKVDILAKQTCGTQDMPRKVTVYIMPPPGDGIHKTRHYFRQFVKPVLDAAAVDYEVKEGSTEGQIQAMVAEDIRKKRQIAAGKTQAQTETDPKTPVAPLKSVSDGIVVLGRIALAEVLKGYNDGCFQSLDDPQPIVATEFVPEVSAKDEAKSLSTEATGSIESSGVNATTKQEEQQVGGAAATTAVTPTAETDAAKGTEAAAPTEPVKIPQDETFFSLPPSGLEPVGYIPFKNLTGFRNFHKKVIALFNSYDCVEYAGGSVMKIAFAETKDLEKDDLEIGRDEEPLFQKYRGPVEIDMSDRVREHVKLYVTPAHIPEPKKAEDSDNDNKE